MKKLSDFVFLPGVILPDIIPNNNSNNVLTDYNRSINNLKQLNIKWLKIFSVITDF